MTSKKEVNWSCVESEGHPLLFLLLTRDIPFLLNSLRMDLTNLKNIMILAALLAPSQCHVLRFLTHRWRKWFVKACPSVHYLEDTKMLVAPLLVHCKTMVLFSELGLSEVIWKTIFFRPVHNNQRLDFNNEHMIKPTTLRTYKLDCSIIMFTFF